MELTYHSDSLRKILEHQGVTEIRVAMAYCSSYGVEMLARVVRQNRLRRDKVTVYLSPAFDTIAPAQVLRDLAALGRVFIVDRSKGRLHAKVIWLEGSRSTGVFGSSNLTAGGWENNLEFNATRELTRDDRNYLSYFFEACGKQAVEVDENVIAQYESRQSQFDAVRRAGEDLERKLVRSLRLDDPFAEDTYDLTGYYFSFKDYETFFPRNVRLKSGDIPKRREHVQERLLNLHSLVEDKMAAFGLAPHWNEAYITSRIVPSSFNRDRVIWMGVRYADNQKVEWIRSEKQRRGTDEFAYGFHKHGCLQFNISAEGFSVALFHAVAHEAVDRSYLSDQNTSARFCGKLNSAIEALQGYGYRWIVADPVSGHADQVFDLDTADLEDFVAFYKRYDREGVESFLDIYLEPDAEELLDEDSIVEFIEEHVKRLLPLYRLITAPVGGE